MKPSIKVASVLCFLSSAAALRHPTRAKLSWRFKRPQAEQRRLSLTGKLPATSAVAPLVDARGGAVSTTPNQTYIPLRAPVEAYDVAVAIGIRKASTSLGRILLLGVMAGLQVGIGAAMAVATLGGLGGLQESNPGLAKLLFGISGLPCSLLMVIATDSELFTANTALVGAAMLEGRVGVGQLLKSWLASYIGNLVGASALAWLCSYAGVFAQTTNTFSAVAQAKASLPFGVAVARGVVSSWLIGTAVWISNAASDLVSKALAIIMVITIFASLGFEHSIANMMLGPFAAMQRHPKVTFLRFFSRNLLPVTIGNAIGGFFLIALTQYLTFGSPSRPRYRIN